MLCLYIKFIQRNTTNWQIEKNRKGENYEIPLAQAKESGEKIDESLLELAASVITEITTNPEWWHF